MLKQFENYIHHHQLFDKDNKLLLAASGGVDSMVLANLLYLGKYNFALAHCNFQLRNNASDEDEALVKAIAKKYGVPFYTKRMEVGAYQKRHKTSVQMAARKLRYNWFEVLVSEHGFDYILTAHHLNDSFETAVFNLAKGTGISGLTGIKERNGKVLRPLLTFTKDTILNYATNNKIEWREDLSNALNKYARNLIRNKVIPVLKELNPDLQHTFQQSASKLKGAEKIVEYFIQGCFENIVERRKDQLLLNKSKLMDTPDPTYVLFHLIKTNGFNYQQASTIIERIGNSGKRFLSEEHELLVDRNFLILSKSVKAQNHLCFIAKPEGQIEMAGYTFLFNTANAINYQRSKENNIAALDLNLLKFPLVLRSWHPGDRFIPLGMEHKKKLSDFMIDNKIPLNLKKRILVLTSAENIVWVAGYRIDDRYKLTNNSTDILEVKMKEND